MDDKLNISNRSFNSRLLLGTGGVPSLEMLTNIIEMSKCEVATVSLRRYSPESIDSPDLTGSPDNLYSILNRAKVQILPNTAGCFTAIDAIRTAQLGRDAFETNWVKLEVIGDEYTLWPDVIELLRACETLAENGFDVLAYTTGDPVVADRLVNLGAKAVMPLGSPIGSGLGISNPHQIQLVLESVNGRVPVILDAGIGTASDASLAMELGCDACLVASAITRAKKPELMAQSISLAIQAGRGAYLAGRIPKRFHANASSSQVGIIEWE